MDSRFTRRAVSASAMASALSAGLMYQGAASHQATPVTDGEWSGVGVDSALQQLPAIVEQLLADTGVPGAAVAVVNSNEVLYAEGFGTRNVDTGEPVTAETVFQVASVSKPISSTVVASVVGQGGIEWSTRLVDVFPEFALNDPWVTAHVTIADLFSHRSGLPDHAGDELEDLGGDRDHVLHALRHIPLAGRFRDSYAYTNFGLTAAAQAVAMNHGSAWEDLAAEFLFSPAGMSNTSYFHSDFMARENRAAGHVPVDGEWVQQFNRQPDAQAPAGGVSSSVLDLARWMRLQLGNGELDGELLIDPAALGETRLPHAISNRHAPPYDTLPGFYGLGWNVGYDANGIVTLSHSGAFAYGAATSVYLWPADDIGIVVLTNGQPIGLPESLCLIFRDLYTRGEPAMDYLSLIGPFMAEELKPKYGDDVVEAPTDPSPAAEPVAYLGLYENDVFGPLEISESNGDLSMSVGPDDMEFALTHFDRDVFTYEPVGEMAGGISAVTFSIDASGLASQVVVENLNLYGAGTFVRQPVTAIN